MLSLNQIEKVLEDLYAAHASERRYLRNEDISMDESCNVIHSIETREQAINCLEAMRTKLADQLAAALVR